MSEDKKALMAKFWSDRAKQYGEDSRANTPDIWIREVEIAYVTKVIGAGSYPNILDFGCANGFTTRQLAEAHKDSKFLGIDINPDMIGIAQRKFNEPKLPNLDFRLSDVSRDNMTEHFDMIYGIRVFQNIESFDMQKKVLDHVLKLLRPGGKLLLIESYVDGYKQINDDRVGLGLPPLPIQPHLTLLTGAFDDYVAKSLTLIEKKSVSSSYYLVTRVLYSYIAKMTNEPIDYNHPIHQVGAIIPQIGDYGPQWATLYRK